MDTAPPPATMPSPSQRGTSPPSVIADALRSSRLMVTDEQVIGQAPPDQGAPTPEDASQTGDEREEARADHATETLSDAGAPTETVDAPPHPKTEPSLPDTPLSAPEKYRTKAEAEKGAKEAERRFHESREELARVREEAERRIAQLEAELATIKTAPPVAPTEDVEQVIQRAVRAIRDLDPDDPAYDAAFAKEFTKAFRAQQDRLERHLHTILEERERAQQHTTQLQQQQQALYQQLLEKGAARGLDLRYPAPGALNVWSTFFWHDIVPAIDAKFPTESPERLIDLALLELDAHVAKARGAPETPPKTLPRPMTRQGGGPAGRLPAGTEEATEAPPPKTLAQALRETMERRRV